MIDDSTLVTFNGATDEIDMGDIYNLARDRRSLSAVLRALKDFDTAEAIMLLYVYASMPMSRQEIMQESAWCTDSILYAALHPYCSGINEMNASTTVRYLNSALINVAFAKIEQDRVVVRGAENTVQRAIIRDMRIGMSQTTFFHPLSRVNAIVWPLNKPNAHWSLIVFYRTKAQSNRWYAFHYDSWLGTNRRLADQSAKRMFDVIREIEPGVDLEPHPLYGEDTGRTGVVHFPSMPQQVSGWECGYKMLAAALCVANADGVLSQANEMIADPAYIGDTACARCIRKFMPKVLNYMLLLNIRTRCRLLFANGNENDARDDDDDVEITNVSDAKESEPDALERNVKTLVKRKNAPMIISSDSDDSSSETV